MTTLVFKVFKVFKSVYEGWGQNTQKSVYVVYGWPPCGNLGNFIRKDT